MRKVNVLIAGVAGCILLLLIIGWRSSGSLGERVEVGTDLATESISEVAQANEEESAASASEPDLDIVVDMEVAQIGDDFIRFRIASSGDTAFTSVIRQNDEIIITQEGLLNAGETLTERIEGLEPGELYTVQSTLVGPPSVTSLEVLFRTNGDIPDPAEDAATPQVNITSLEITDVGPTHFQFDYFLDQCANGNFLVVNQETGEEVGRNMGGPESCVDRSLGVPGVWTPPLEPETTYVVTVSAEANGRNRGRPYGNVDTEILVFTTPPRPIPDDPTERSLPPVEFTSIEVRETTDTTVRVDFSTNVCTNASFVVREVGGSEVGRHPGSARGCATNHSAIAGLWTEPLAPESDYVIVLTAEADGAGQGEGNISTESINVSTVADLAGPEVPPEAVEIELLEPSVDGSTGTVVVETNVCAEVTVTSFVQLGEQLGDPVGTTECSSTTEIGGVPLAPDGVTVVFVTVEGEAFGPLSPNRASDVVTLTR